MLTPLKLGAIGIAVALTLWRLHTWAQENLYPSVDRAPDSLALTAQPAATAAVVAQYQAEVYSVQNSSHVIPVSDVIQRPPVSTGRPFHISPSVAMECSTSKEPRPPCKDVYPKLAELSKEIRDSAWAPLMERKLRENFQSDPHGLSIRALECRRSLCAAEVATNDGTYTGPSGDFLFNNDLFLGTDDSVGAMFGFETDATGARIQVTVMIFARRG